MKLDVGLLLPPNNYLKRMEGSDRSKVFPLSSIKLRMCMNFYIDVRGGVSIEGISQKCR